ncbi:hypothetical protein Scep_029045 [Stephania cephalantha]|uniref:Uncharacterized protein n=1 Tax=Stephania cephalantha TaxID=152367 RepID=A0AAP0HD59_9MAGN
MMKWRSSRTRKADGDEQQEELVLFRDMLQRRDTDRILTLLQPAVFSDDLLDSANSLYRLPSAKRSSSSSGLGLLELTDNKNDYDWLKTPPATPLFPSLEMEVNAPELALHRDIPVIQHLSRFAGGISEQASTKANGATISKSHMPKPKNNPSRSVTPGNGARPTPPAPTRPLRPMTPSAMRVQQAPQPDHKLAPKIIQFNNKISCNSSSAPSLNTAGPGKDSKSKSWRGRGVSPMVRSRTPAASNIPVGFSDDETLVPSRTGDRSSSASRSRPSAAIHPKQEPVVLVVKPRRQSCSPSMARGRKTAEDKYY